MVIPFVSSMVIEHQQFFSPAFAKKQPCTRDGISCTGFFVVLDYFLKNRLENEM
jgi:hypothetical protein